MVSNYRKIGGKGMNEQGKTTYRVASTCDESISQHTVVHLQCHTCRWWCYIPNRVLHENFQFSIEWVKAKGSSSQNLESECHRDRVLVNHTLRQHYLQDSYRSCRIRSGNRINNNSDAKIVGILTR